MLQLSFILKLDPSGSFKSPHRPREPPKNLVSFFIRWNPKNRGALRHSRRSLGGAWVLPAARKARSSPARRAAIRSSRVESGRSARPVAEGRRQLRQDCLFFQPDSMQRWDVNEQLAG